jgi:glutathione S-transferase
MEASRKQYKLYLPAGAINTDRILYLLQFARLSNTQIEMIQKGLISKNAIREEGNGESVRTVSLEEMGHKDNSDLADRAYLSSRLSDYEKFIDPITAFSQCDEEKLKTTELSYSEEDVRLTPLKRNSQCHKDLTSKSIHGISDQPCLVVSKSKRLHEPDEIYQELKSNVEFTINLLDDEHAVSIASTINRIVHYVDTHVRKVLEFIDQFVINESEDLSTLFKAKYKDGIGKSTEHIKFLYESLEYFEKNLLPAGQFLNGSSFSLSDIYLFAALIRPFQLLFDKKIRKFWLPNLTAWFKICRKSKEAQSVFGELKICKISHLQIIEQSLELSRPSSHVSKTETETPSSLRAKLEQFVNTRSGNIVIDRSFEGYFEDLKLGDIPDKYFSLWSFRYLTATEETFQGEYFSRKMNAVDEVEEFTSNFIKDLQTENKDESVTYIVTFSKCEEVKAVFSLGKQKLQECENHRGRFMTKKECAGFTISFSKSTPNVVREYEQKDLIEVKPVEERKTFIRKMLLLRDDEEEMEKVYTQHVI